jgi:superfamily II DNA or RNA helicase
MVQTCKKHLPELVPRFGQLVVDEAHHCPSSTFSDCVSAFDSKFLLGLTATPFRRDGLGRLINWSLGDVVHKVCQAHLRKTGAIMEPEIVPVKTNYQFWGDASKQYSKMISHLAEDEGRNRLIISRVLQETKQQSGVLLLLSDRVGHLETLTGMLANHGEEVAILTGSTPKKRREQIVSDLSRGKIKILGSTMALLCEGFDCPELSTLFLCSPIKFKGRLLQVAGRVMRPQDGKVPRIIDFVDSEEPVLAASFRARERAYKQLAV